VLALHRDRIGGLELPTDLEPGGWRPITTEEQAAIFA
jgi:16S rRNA pseudouridine516 synthase